uniref:Uncharacterized protein n=1 Tax=Rhizophora mucronata TaxID=61149 RepID=A0A2P2PT87_RHIMU
MPVLPREAAASSRFPR